MRGTQPIWHLFLATLLFVAPVLAAEGEQMVMSEEALWSAAGETYVGDEDKTAALQQYQHFLNRYEKSRRAARAQFMIAECYFVNGDYETALIEYGKVEKRKGRNDYIRASAMLRMGECQYNLDRLPEAMQTFTLVAEKYGHTFLEGEALFALGQVQAALQSWRGLSKTYQRLLEDRPGYRGLPRVKFALGLYAYVEGDYETAAEHFAEVKSDLGLYYLGRCLESSGQYILAVQRYRQCLRLYPDSHLSDDVAFSIGEAFYNSDQNRVALRSYKDFLEQYPDSRFTSIARYKEACVLFRMEEHTDCIRKLEDLCDELAGEPICAPSHYLIGTAYMQMGRTSHAIFAFTEVVRGYDDSELASAAMHKIVYAYAHEKNYPQAILMAREFLDLFPGDDLVARVQVLKGWAHMELQEFDLAVREFQNVLDRHVNTEVGERALFLSTSVYTELEQFDRLITNYHFIANRLLPTPSVWRARTYYHLGEAYYNQQLYREAGGMYRLVLTGYPRSDVAAASLQGLVASYSQVGEYELALEEQEKFLLELANADSEEGGNSLALGSLYFNQHNYEEALEAFTTYIQRNPDSPSTATALLNQGDCFYRLQYYENAVDVWNELVTRFPRAPEVEEAMYKLADTRFGLGRFEEARASYASLQQRAPDGDYAADAAFGLANCYYNQQLDDQAIEYFQMFVQKFPDDPRTEDAELGIQSAYYRSGKDMEEYLGTRPDSPLAADYYWTKGQNAFAEEKYEAAARYFEQVTLDYADSESAPGALFYLAESYYRMEENHVAQAVYRNFITTHPEHELIGLSRFRLGTVLYKMEDYVGAAVEYETLADLDPDGQYSPLALFNAGLCYQELEEWPSAIGVLVRFQMEYPDHERAQGISYQIATLYQDELGDFENAIEAYQKVLERGEAGIEEIGYRQGQCFEKLERHQEAIASYEMSASGADRTAAHRIASLAQIGQLSEDRGDWNTAIQAYTRIVQANGKPEWTAMAQGRIAEIQAQSTGN
ncbi:tetratricopeptide repeat protein [bacterium]|nr:tetratricopeptide repeat protein [bacterium]